MSQLDTTSAIEATAAKLYDKLEPTLKSGHYTIKVANALDGFHSSALNNQANQFFQHKTVTQNIGVGGEQFSILPTEIFSKHPAPNSAGNFEKIMPYIQFNRASLPWIRNGKTGQSWMALVLLTKEDLALSYSSTQTKLPSDAAIISQTVRQFLQSSQSNIIKTNLTASDIQPSILEKNCQSIIINKTTFQVYQNVFANSNLFCHVRHTDQSYSITHSGLNADEAPQDGKTEYSVVLSNFYPTQSNTTYYVHLVSLEGLEGYINNGLPSGTKGAQLVSLAHWQFSNNASENEGFKNAALQLIQDDQGQLCQAEDLLLRFPIKKIPNQPSAAQSRLKQGYIQKVYKGYKGQIAPSWYRGPFFPNEGSTPANDSLDFKGFKRAANFMCYHQASQTLNLSHSAAFDLGKLLALSNESFRQAIVSARQRFRQTVRREMEMANSKYIIPNQEIDRARDKTSLSDNFHSHAYDRLFQIQREGSTSDTHETDIRDGQKKRASHLTIESVHQSYNSKLDDGRLNEKATLFLEKIKDEVEVITSYLAKLSLFNFIPFNYLVPSVTFLPTDAIRFFYIDDKWVNTLIQGALLTGQQHSGDTIFNEVFTTTLYRQSQHKALNHRKKALGINHLTNLPTDSSPVVKAGFFIRSGFVNDFPGVSIHSDANILRLEKIASGLLICLFDAIPTQLSIKEATVHGLQFGKSDQQQIIQNSYTSSAKAASDFTKEQQVLNLLTASNQ
ncbi:MAG: hypothetical protein AAGA77_18685 [Bacteroidota bacterium]